MYRTARDGIVEDYLIAFHDVKTFLSYLRRNEHIERARLEVIQYRSLFFLCQATVVGAEAWPTSRTAETPSTLLRTSTSLAAVAR